MQKCAIKLVYSLDLTSDEINKVAAEATLLNSVKHKHVVHIYGVSVLPPSVCILLELCPFGSLSDVLRGSSNQTMKPLTLSYMDKVYLGLGCARGLAALHAVGEEVVHRDIKSFNFLVDAQLNAKLADLELGVAGKQEEIDPETLLPNWTAPEVLLGKVYTQASDIYSLSLVLWEIISGDIPYGDIPGTSIEKFNTIRSQVADLQCRLNVPQGYDDIEAIIREGWQHDSSSRPSAIQIVNGLMDIWRAASCGSKAVNIQSEVVEEVSDQTISDDETGMSRKVIGPRIHDVLQTWYASSEYKKHVLSIGATTVVSAADGPRQYSDVGVSATPAGDNNLDHQQLGARLFVKDRPLPSNKQPESTDLDNSSDGSRPLLQKLYDSIKQHPDWVSLVASKEPLLIVTKSAPHVIMCASTAWSRMTGYKPVQVFGHSLEEFVVRESQDNSEVAVEDKPFVQNSNALKLLFEDMECFSRSKSSFFGRSSSNTPFIGMKSSNITTTSSVPLVGEDQHSCSHCLVSIYKLPDYEKLNISVHGFPVLLPDDYEENKEWECIPNSANGSPKRQRFRTFSLPNEDFCILYMNELDANASKTSSGETAEARGSIIRGRSRSSSSASLRRSSVLTDRFSIS